MLHPREKNISGFSPDLPSLELSLTFLLSHDWVAAPHCKAPRPTPKALEAENPTEQPRPLGLDGPDCPSVLTLDLLGLGHI